MRKPLLLSLAAVILIVAGPVLLRQLLPAESRTLEAPSPDPSRFREIRFRNTAQDLDLAGLLFVPPGRGPFPAAVIIHGSGDSSRGNRWYLSLVHYLQDHGIVVLLPDKRGSEQSGGDWHDASFEDLATDTLAAVNYLQAQTDVALSRIGLIGMSQGGWIAPLAATQDPSIDYLVNVVGSAVTTHQQFLYEENLNLREAGFLPGISNLFALLSTAVHRHIVQRDFWNAIGDFDPLPYWRQVDVPSLVLYGADDHNTPSEASAERLQALDNPRLRIVIYAGSGHALQDPPGQGNRLFREDALQAIDDFIAGTGN